MFALALSYIALRVAALPADDRHTYGWHRLEVFAALANGVTLLGITAAIFYEAWERLQNPTPIHSVGMLTIAAIGLVANLGVARLLRDHHDDLNTRSAFLHVIGDALASVGVIVGGVVMLATGWYVVDAVISAFIGLIILAGSWRVLRGSLHILFEGTPEGIAIREVAHARGTIRYPADCPQSLEASTDRQDWYHSQTTQSSVRSRLLAESSFRLKCDCPKRISFD